MITVRFVPSDLTPEPFKGTVTVPLLPRIGESVYLRGLHFRVADVAHFYGGPYPVGPDQIIITLERAQ